MKTMNQQLEKIYQKKKKNRDIMTAVRNNCVAIIYDGFVKNKSIRDIHKELKQATINEKRIDLNFMYENGKNLVKRLNRLIDKRTAVEQASIISGKKETQADAIAVLFLLFFARLDGGNFVGKGITQSLDEDEGKEKEILINETIESARENSQIFYLASQHNDCAKDHRDYQGKYYVDENWQNYTNNPKVGDFIRTHNIKTFQWVTSKPVWFTTRPNCRHYFRALNTDEVLGEKKSNLISKYNMQRQVGQRGTMQTLSHPTNAKWYSEKKNIEGIISKYEERLAMHEKMYQKFKHDDLKRLINKDKELIKKWKIYLNKKF